MPVIPEFKRQKQEDHNFKVILRCILSSQPGLYEMLLPKKKKKMIVITKVQYFKWQVEDFVFKSSKCFKQLRVIQTTAHARVSSCQLGMVAHMWNSSISEIEVEDQESKINLHRELQDNLGYMRPYLKKLFMSFISSFYSTNGWHSGHISLINICINAY